MRVIGFGFCILALVLIDGVCPAVTGSGVGPVVLLKTTVSEAEAADAQLNKIYKMLVGVLDKEEQGRLVAAERDWIAYRDAQCELESAYADRGRDRTVNFAVCLARMTRQRTEVLSNQPFYPIPGVSKGFPSSTAPADNHTWAQMKQDIADACDQADSELGKICKLLAATLDKDEQALLNASQAAWMKFRQDEADFEAMYTGFGSDFHMNWPGAWLSIIETRTAEIQALLAQRVGK
jgi:uncharacterized protein YecT (DUF1311 family)